MSGIETKNKRLNAFRSIGKYCDVNIQVGTKVFQVHKVIVAAASEYFERIFNEHPDEDIVILPEDEIKDVNLFEEVVLPFIYMDDVDDPIIYSFSQNVVELLRMSALLTIQSLEDRCIHFIKQVNFVIPNILNLFTAVTSLNKPSWIPVLSCYIMKNFAELCDDKLLMEFSFEDFKVLLGSRFFLSPNNEDTFVNTLIKWCHHCEEGRREHFNYLIDCTKFPNISASYMKLLLKNFHLKTPSVDNSPPCLSTDDYELNEIKYGKPISGLHMYIADDARKIRVYSSNKTTAEWNVSSVRQRPPIKDWCWSSSIESLELDDRLYTLESLTLENTFNVRSDVTFSSDVHSLKPPPIGMDIFSMCSSRKNIYVKNYESKNFNVSQDVDVAFDMERISQGIFEYKIAVDKWFPVPLMDEKLDGSAVTAYNDVLYLVGGKVGKDLSSRMRPQGSDISIHALDVRTSSRWKNLTRNFFNRSYDFSSGSLMIGCAHEGKIYVCAGHGSVVGIYNLRANDWEKFVRMNDADIGIYQLLFHENYMWTFGRMRNHFIHDTGPLCEIKVLDPRTQEWSPSPFSDVNRATEYDSRNICFESAFSFKSTLF